MSKVVPWLLGASFVEWLGTGLFLAVSALYFVRQVGLSAPEVGAGLAVAGVVALLATVPIGLIADRAGAKPVLVTVNLVRAAGTAGYLLVDGWWTFLLVSVVVIFCEQAAPALVQSLVGGTVGADRRTRVMAAYRTIVNLAISIGGLLASAALGSMGDKAFAVLFIADACAFTVAAAIIARVGAQTKPDRPRGSVLTPFRDRRLLVLTGINGMTSLWLPILNIGFPLWLTQATDAPVSLVGVLYAVNTVACVVLQYPLSRFERDPLRMYGVASVALAVSCGGFVLASFLHGAFTVAALVAAIVALTLGELIAFISSTTLSYEIAPTENRGAYLAAYGMGRTVSTRIAGPVLLTGVVLALGWPGWALLAAAFVLTSLLIRTKAVRNELVAARTARRSG